MSHKCICPSGVVHSECHEHGWRHVVAERNSLRKEVEHWKQTALTIQANTKETCAYELRKAKGDFIEADVEREELREANAALVTAASALLSRLAHATCAGVTTWPEIPALQRALASPASEAGQ